MTQFFTRAVSYSILAFFPRTPLPYCMSNPPSKSQRENPPAPSPPRRIQTQIHRRNKAKAVSPLTDEWEDSLPAPGDKFKMPPENMKKN